MPRGVIPISKVHDDEPTAQRKGSSWLDSVQDMLAQKQETAVENSRARASMINQVNNILSNPPRYATVDDAVQDLRERTGLNSYLKNIKASKKRTKKASIRKRDYDGLLTEANAKSLVDVISGKKKLLTKANLEKKSDVLLNRIEDLEDKVEDLEDKIPECLKKYDAQAIEDIISFLKNNIENSHGLSSTVPQLQHDIIHILGPKYNINYEDINNGEFSKFINKFILDAQSKYGPTETSPMLGQGVGQDLNSDENQDYWAGMMPIR